MSCSAQNYSRRCGSTGADYSASQAHGCFQATAGIPVIRRSTPRWCGTLARKPPSERASRKMFILTCFVTIWTSRLCRVEDESVQLNELLLQALIDWADLATRHSPAAL